MSVQEGVAMPVEMIGWIAPRVSSELIPASGPPFAAEVIRRSAQTNSAKRTAILKETRCRN